MDSLQFKLTFPSRTVHLVWLLSQGLCLLLLSKGSGLDRGSTLKKGSAESPRSLSHTGYPSAERPPPGPRDSGLPGGPGWAGQKAGRVGLILLPPVPRCVSSRRAASHHFFCPFCFVDWSVPSAYKSGGFTVDP